MQQRWWWGAVLGAGVLGGLVASTLPRGTYAATSPDRTVVTVTGSSTTNVVPSGAQVSLGFQNNGASAAATLARNNVIMNQIIAKMRGLGIPNSDLQTSGLNINPNYGNGNSPTITGYQVSDGLNVTLTKLALVGPVLDAAVAAGANQVNGVTFTTGNQQVAYRTSYAGAMANALQQADAIAAPLHEHVVGVQSVQVQNSYGIAPQTFMVNHAAATPVLPGQQQVSVSLQVVYQLAP